MMTQEKIDSIRERMCEECCAFSTLSQLVKDEVCNTCPLNELEASAEPEPIRCKYCKWWDDGRCYCDDVDVRDHEYMFGDMRTEATHFCGYAERRDDE